MSFLSRISTRVLVCCVASAATFGALSLAPAAGATKIGSTYLALGDSLAYGYHAAQFKEEIAKGGGTSCFAGKCITPANFNDGYVDDFGGFLKVVHPGLQVINDGCPGETTETMINGSGIPFFCAGGKTGTPFPDVWLHHPYPAGGSQLADAEAILTANPKAGPITLDIGANDALQACGPPKTCTPAEIGALYTKIAGNVYLILTKLRALSSAQIVVIGLYNPFPTVVPDAATAALNAAEEGVATKVSGVSFANPLPLFNPSVITGGPETQDIPTICAFTAMCPGGTFNPASPQADIHPTKLGYAVMAGVTAFSFLTH